MESGVIKYDAPGSFEGITEIGYSIADELGNTVFSGTVKITVTKKKADDGTDTATGDKKTWKQYIWIPVLVFVGAVLAIIWKKSE
jgi:hypothetical protein